MASSRHLTRYREGPMAQSYGHFRHIRTGMGQKGLAARWCLQIYTRVWVCAICVQSLKINGQNRRGDDQSSACAQQFKRGKKLTAAALRFKKIVHLTERFNHGPNYSRASVRGWRKVASKAPPRMHCRQPCRQSRSRRVLSTVNDLI